MKYIIAISSVIVLVACNQQKNDSQFLQTQIDSLQNKLDNTYKPGLGEFMSGIQVHHAKLWFAGTNNNWKLADFEINEIKESLQDIRQYCSDRPEIKSIGMIDPAIDNVSNAIQHRNGQLFKSNYILLTNTCNNCHHATNHEFNVIKIPETPPVSNQDFKTVQ
jgi:hypothetical protein